jgi:hypothetical protein
MFVNPKLKALRELDEGGPRPVEAASHGSIFGTAPSFASNDAAVQDVQQAGIVQSQQAQDDIAAANEVAALEREIERLPDSVKGPLLDKLKREQSFAGPSGIPNMQAVASIAQEANAEQQRANGRVAEEAYQKMMGAVAGGALFAFGLGELPHLAPILAPSHSKLEKEYQLLSGHGVAGSGLPADRFDLGVMTVPAGLPAISKQIQMQRNEGFVRNIADDKKLS